MSQLEALYRLVVAPLVLGSLNIVSTLRGVACLASAVTYST